MSTTFSETTRKTNKHLIRESFLFTRESSKGTGGPKLGPHIFPIFFFLSFSLFSRFIFADSRLLGAPLNPSRPPFGPPLAWEPVKNRQVEPPVSGPGSRYPSHYHFSLTPTHSLSYSLSRHIISSLHVHALGRNTVTNKTYKIKETIRYKISKNSTS